MQNGEKPAIVHPFVAFFPFQDEKAQKACIIAGFSCFYSHLIEKPAFSQAFFPNLVESYIVVARSLRRTQLCISPFFAACTQL
ncbi:hypothetical protein HQN90_04470 [Paenibacillus alba]|nr:hypothetical protein [Paenibacillus alba]